MKKRLLTMALAVAAILPSSADRYTALLAAKQLVLTTTTGQTYYYLLSSMATTMMQFDGDEVLLNNDTFRKGDIKSMRVKNIGRFVLDEDSVTFGKNYATDHAILALRRTFAPNQWNSLVLPVSLTGEQVRDAFGEDAMLAQIRGFRKDDDAAIELQTIDLQTADVVLQANKHYILMPTREPDVVEGEKAYLSSTLRPAGPIYLIPGVSMQKNQSPETKTYRSATTSVAQQGTYTARDGQANKKVRVGSYPIYQLDDKGVFTVHADSVLAKAFTSWFVDTSKQPQQLRFYIDGVSMLTTVIDQTVGGRMPWEADDRIYDLQGRYVGRKDDQSKLPKGVYVKEGRKFIVK